MPEEDRYEGETNEDGEPHGQGNRYYAVGDRYEGQWKDGKEHGSGVMEYTSGYRYEGQWKDGKRHGQGVYTFADGDRYEGPWKDDKHLGREPAKAVPMCSDFDVGSRRCGERAVSKCESRGCRRYMCSRHRNYSGGKRICNFCLDTIHGGA